MAKYIQISTQIYNVYLKYIAPEDIHVYSIDEVKNRWYVRTNVSAAAPEGAQVLSNPDDKACSAFITAEALSEKELRTKLNDTEILAVYRVLD